MKKAIPTIITFSVLAAVLSFLLLLTPKREIGECVRVLSPFFSFVKIVLNCDSSSIVEQSTRQFSDLFDTPNMWGSRPAYILLVHSLHTLVLFFVNVIWNFLGDFIFSLLNQSFVVIPDEIWKVKKLLSAGIAAIVINFLIVFGTIKLIFEIFAVRKIDKYGIILVVFTFDFVAGWLWVPHMIFANLIVPFGGILFYRVGLSFFQQSLGKLVLLAVFGSVMTLFYSYCVIWLPLLIIGYIHSILVQTKIPGKTTNQKHLPRVFLTSFVFSGPVAFWWGINIIEGNQFEMTVTHYRQFTWIVDSYHNQDLFHEMAKRFGSFANSLGETFDLFGLIIVIMFFLLLLASICLPEKKKQWKAILAPSLICILMMLFFNFFQGYYQPRLQIGILLVLILLNSMMLSGMGMRKSNTIFLYCVGLTQLFMNFASPAISQT